jgi:hypothetical protein
VSRAGDIDLGLVLAALDGTGSVGLEEFRMERPPIQSKYQFRDFRPNI